VQLVAENSANRNGSYLWTLQDGSTRLGRVLDLTDPVPGTYSVTFSDAVGCGSATANFELIIVGTDFDLDVVVTNLEGEIIDGGLFPSQTVVLTAVGVPAGLEVAYSWSGNFTPASDSGNPIQVTIPGSESNPTSLEYFVTATTTTGGCDKTAEVLRPIIQASVQTPDVITPNGDGTNDFFRIFYTQSAEVEDFTLSIFNRWGQKIFTSGDIDEGWDGTINGTPQNMDTYLFVAKFRINGEEQEREGQFSLIR
jgi:gliding motility-associated-like protein